MASEKAATLYLVVEDGNGGGVSVEVAEATLRPGNRLCFPGGWRSSKGNGEVEHDLYSTTRAGALKKALAYYTKLEGAALNRAEACCKMRNLVQQLMEGDDA